MRVTLIVRCTKCGGLMLATKGQRTKICPYCGTRVDFLRAQCICSASSALEASEMLRKLKSEQGFNRNA